MKVEKLGSHHESRDFHPQPEYESRDFSNLYNLSSENDFSILKVEGCSTKQEEQAYAITSLKTLPRPYFMKLATFMKSTFFEI